LIGIYQECLSAAKKKVGIEVYLLESNVYSVDVYIFFFFFYFSGDCSLFRLVARGIFQKYLKDFVLAWT